MRRVESPALRGTWLGRLLRVWNPVMVKLLTSPLHWPWSTWFLLLSWTGPKTGRVHSIPVSYVPEDGRAWATTGDTWWRNAVEAPSVSVRLRGRHAAARVSAIGDPEESLREHSRLFAGHAFFRRLAGIGAREGAPDEDAIRRSIGAGRTLLRIDLDLPRARPGSR